MKKSLLALLALFLFVFSACGGDDAKESDDDKDSDDKPAEDKPADDKPADDEPADDKPADSSVDVDMDALDKAGYQFDDLSDEEGTIVHNDLVTLMDAFVDADTAYYDLYISFQTEDELADLEASFEELKASIDALDSYLMDTTWDEDQAPIIQIYVDTLKPALDEYAAAIADFHAALTEDFEGAMTQDNYDKVETAGSNEVDAYDVFLNEVNTQADDYNQGL